MKRYVGNQSPFLQGETHIVETQKLFPHVLGKPTQFASRLSALYKTTTGIQRPTYQVLISFSYLISKNINHSLGGEYFGGKEYSKESRLFCWFSS